MADAKWLKGNVGTEFLQFAAGRITRERFPLGGYLYRSTDSGSQEQLYSGNDFEAARTAVSNITTGENT